VARYALRASGSRGSRLAAHPKTRGEGGLRTRTGLGIGSSTQAGVLTSTVSITLSPKVPSRTPASFTATAVMMVLAACYAYRRRF
jgi:hypothetical protein